MDRIPPDAFKERYALGVFVVKRVRPRWMADIYNKLKALDSRFGNRSMRCSRLPAPGAVYRPVPVGVPPASMQSCAGMTAVVIF